VAAPKVVVARISALTLITGFVAGWLYGRPPGGAAVEIVADGGGRVRAVCGEASHEAPVRLRLPTGVGRCSVAIDGVGEATLDTSQGGQYRCRRWTEGVTCERS
jgi:hypothetical protein